MLAISRLLALTVGATLTLSGSALEDGLNAFHQGKFSIALPLLKEASAGPNEVTARAFLALTEAAMNDCPGALPGLVSSQTSQEPALVRMTGLAAAKCYSASGDDANAFSLLQRLRQAFPDDADVLYISAKLHMQSFNDSTLAMFQKVPSSYLFHVQSAEIFEIDKRYTEAIAEYRKAIAVNPQAPEIRFRLGRAILMQAHSSEALDQAAAEFTAELKLSPEDAACEFQLGQIAQVEGKEAEAQLHFERALSLSPKFVEALIALAKTHVQRKQNLEAISLLQRAIALQPENERAHYILLTAYRNAGNLEKAGVEKDILDKLQKPPEGEFSEFLKRLGEKPPPP